MNKDQAGFNEAASRATLTVHPVSSSNTTITPSSTSKTFTCDECGVVLKDKKNLGQHKASKHSNERPYLCTITSCTRATDGFVRKACLRYHT
ncbi:hypothetical protein GE09DRAFT_1231610 [Coniochaeta sp. 2T2.1]|nr:hypothetical protein GE09DRAFT_1231610 [Coniochaeta sp. 2T2.1]